MTQLPILTLLFLGQAQDTQDYKVYTDPPRLLVNPRRLRLLQRERDRQSIRWQQFDALMSGGAAMAEPGFADALYGIVTAKPGPCRAASDWAAKGEDLRQVAIVYDWCKPANKSLLAARLKPLLNRKPDGVLSARTQAFAALALADDEPDASALALKRVAEEWWRGSIVPAIKAGRYPFRSRAELYALLEIVHVLHDNFKIELRDDALKYFDELPALEMLTYYPAPFPAAENFYRIPVYTGSGEPDLREAALGRAADLALVASDTNAQSNQFLQGWLLLDRYLLRGAFGITYEFLWANPYLPGLSYYYMPDLYHANGRLLLRSTWDDDAIWFGLMDGQAQLFRDGQRLSVKMQSAPGPIEIGRARVLFSPAGMKFDIGLQPVDEESRQREEFVYLLNLKPKGRYDVEVDDEEMYETVADEAGILPLRFPLGRKAGVRVKDVRGL